ncbi:hypothetical protein HYU15_00930 [Candidatus Woesearchaeota archaeon]|nr:hypothetical protein [Candidatus Woesearchaeota archaeon]
MNENELACLQNFSRARDRYYDVTSFRDGHFYADGLRDVWISFSAYLNLKFPNPAITEKFKLLSQRHEEQFWKIGTLNEFSRGMEMLKKLSPVKDMRVNPKRDAVLNDSSKLQDILYFCYRVRCNLEHGHKDIETNTEHGIRNRALVEHSFFVSYSGLRTILLMIEKMPVNS